MMSLTMFLSPLFSVYIYFVLMLGIGILSCRSQCLSNVSLKFLVFLYRFVINDVKAEERLVRVENRQNYYLI